MSFMKRMPIVGNHGSDAFLFLLQFCVKSVLNAAMLPYDAGVEKEAEYFRDLVVSSQAAAQRYSFFAERAISRVCYKYGLVATNLSSGFPAKWDSNPSVQLQRLARKLKFRL